jgi:DNA-binding response OmpR family regulator
MPRRAWVCAYDATVAAAVVVSLTELGYAPDRVVDPDPARATRELAGGTDPDVAIIAAGGATLPHAAAVVAAIRELEELRGLPLLLALHRDALSDAAAALDVDEILVVGAGSDELRLRIGRARRRSGALGEGDTITLGGLELNVATHETTVDGRRVDLTHLEHRLLAFLLTHPRRVFTREALLERVWEYEYYGATRTVDVHIRRLRAKLGEQYGACIQTVRSVGYRLER